MKKRVYNIFVLIALLLLVVACSKDSADDSGYTATTTQEEASNVPLKMVGLTRSTTDDDDTEQLYDIHALLTFGETLTEGKFKYSSDTEEWTTQLKLKSGSRSYRLYGLMPDDPSLTVSLLTPWTASSAEMRLENVNPLTLNDYCVITGVRQVESETDKTSATRGTFSFEYNSNRQNYINLYLDHIMSRLVFRMRVGSTYNTVRTIKVKKMTLKLANISRMRVTVTLADNYGISAISYYKTGIAANSCIIGSEEKTLTTTSTDIYSAYIIPNEELINNLELETEFDVYDKKGNKIAERTATNKLTTPLNELQRGEERSLMITVDPSYLYVLSDADLNNPTITIE